MSTVAEDYGLRAVQPANVVGLKTVDTKGVVESVELIGIEVEVENARNLREGMNRVWILTEDGSLRNGGVEFITRPIAAVHAPTCLQYLLHMYLTEECCFSPRTSVHVHLNVQDITRAQVMDIVLIYSVFEKLFYKYAGAGRHKNVYCVPLTECGLLTNLVDFGETRDRQWQKYTGLNTLPILQHGTIEFRHMHGTNDVVKLSNWISLICKLKEYVRKHSTKEIRTMIAAMYDGYDFSALLQDIFGNLAGTLKYEGPHELSYLQAKQALVPTAYSHNVRRSYNANTAFAKFKG